MKKFVLKVDLHDDKAKQKAMKTVSTLTDFRQEGSSLKNHSLMFGYKGEVVEGKQIA